MLATRGSRRHERDNQMFFSWGEPSRKKAARPATKPKPMPVTTAPSLENDLREMCMLLHQLAQKYVPRANFQDRDTLVQCTKLLQDKRFEVTVAEDLQAHVNSFNPSVITHAPQYRLMRNRAIAALATVADLAGKAPARGSSDYQQGMRDGFQAASDIAVLFLEDIEAAYEFRR